MKTISNIIKFLTIIVVLFIIKENIENLVIDLFDLNYEKIADKITERTAEKIRKEKRLCLIGTGGRMMNDIQLMSMDFQYFHEVDYDTAGELLVYCVEEYLHAINSSEKIRPYLHEFPFTAKNIRIAIFFYRPDGRNLPFGKIAIASAVEGEVKYQADNPNGYTLDRLHTETYEETLQILHSRNHGDKT